MDMNNNNNNNNNNNLKSPVVVFAHGAGTSSTSDWIIRWKNLLASALNAVEVVTFDYPYINSDRKSAPKPETLVGYHADIVRKVSAKYPSHPLILAGKSMGSRVSCMVAAENDIEAAAIVCLGYPLTTANGVIREDLLLQLKVPVMFVQGSNDKFCPLDTLETIRNKLKVFNDLHVIEYADHSFQVASVNLELIGMTREVAEERAVEAVAVFVSQITGGQVINQPKDITRAYSKDALPSSFSARKSADQNLGFRICPEKHNISKCFNSEMSSELSLVKCDNRKSPVVVLAHGGSTCSTSEWIVRWKNLLANALNAVEVVTFDYPYVNSGRKSAPSAERLVGYHADIVRNVAAKYPSHPLILAGKSMGSRISCMVAAENDIEASAVVCLGYPLKAANRVTQNEPLLQLTVPVMFVQGSNDIFCPLDKLKKIRNKLQVFNDLHVIEYADHSFQVARKYLDLSGMTHEEAEKCAAEAVAVFVSQITRGQVINRPTDITTRGNLPAAQRPITLVTTPTYACPKDILSQHVSRTEACAKDDAVGERKRKRVKSKPKPKPKVKDFSSVEQKQRTTQNIRKRKLSERILKNKLAKCVYVEGGIGLTVDNPVDID